MFKLSYDNNMMLLEIVRNSKKSLKRVDLWSVLIGLDGDIPGGE